MESMEGLDNHRAEDLFKQFQTKISHKQNWSPSFVHRKLKIKSNRIFKSNERSLRATEDFAAEPRFDYHLRHDISFLVCVETKNLSPKDIGQQYALRDFLADDYEENFIWGIGRATRNDCRNTLRKFSNHEIEIPDLNFGADRENQITALCPMADIVLVLLLEEKYGVSVVYNKKYHKLKSQRDQKYIVPQTKYANFFKTKNKIKQENQDKNKENQDPKTAGPSGLNSQSSHSSSLSASFRSDSSSLNNDATVESQPVPTQPVPTQQVPNTSHTVPPSSPKPYHEDHEQLSSDEDEMSHENDDRSIVFKGQYAEVTSKGVTRKIMIGTTKSYPKLISKVGF